MLARAGNLLSINATTLMRALRKREIGTASNSSGTKRGAKLGKQDWRSVIFTTEKLFKTKFSKA